MFSLSRPVAILLVTPVLVAGCVAPRSSGGDAASASLSVEDILARCESTYSKLRTLDAAGFLRDYRGNEKRVAPIRWELARPDLCRLQIDMDAVLVKGPNWWSYDHRAERFKSHRELGPAPIESAAYFLSNGIPFVMPVAWHRPKIAFGPSPERGPWRLDGVAWTANRPCYVVTREGLGRDSGGTWTFWIDQDRFLIVAWEWKVQRVDRRGPPTWSTIWGCTYEVIAVDQAIDPARFRIEKPQPIVLPKPAPSEAREAR